MKKNSEYKKAERKRKKESGLKRFELWIYPCDEPKIKDYIWMLTNETKIAKNNT